MMNPENQFGVAVAGAHGDLAVSPRAGQQHAGHPQGSQVDTQGHLHEGLHSQGH